MKKLTGYIGAMIIVFALMGSILTGYALNVNGQSTVINEYESVTDVSGLYSYTDEKTYIEYNPASNYTGYKTTPTTYTNPTGGGTYTFKKIESGGIGIDENRQLYIDGVIQGYISGTPAFAIFSDKFYCIYENNDNTLMLCDSVRRVNSSGITSISKTGTNVSITIAGNTYTYSNVNLMVAYCTTNPDYYLWRTYEDGTPRDIYLNNDLQSVILVRYTKLGLLYNDQWFSTYINLGQTDTISSFNNGVSVDNGVKKYASDGILPSPYLIDTIIYPMTVESIPDMGVDYTESNRVNNYPVVKNPENTTIQTTQLDLTNISATDHYPTLKSPYTLSFNNGVTVINSPGHTTTLNDFDNLYGNHQGLLGNYMCLPWGTSAGQSSNDSGAIVHNYRLSDILVNTVTPANTKTIRIDTDSTDDRTGNAYNANNNANIGTWSVDGNIAYINTTDQWSNYQLGVSDAHIIVNGGANNKDYLIYNVANGTVDIYDSNGVKTATKSPNDVYILFMSNLGSYAYCVNDYSTSGETNGYFNFSNRAAPFINLTYEIYNASEIAYIDISKGYTIDPTNVDNVTFDNQYENGVIDLLFRAQGASGNFENGITVSNNDILVEYKNNGFYITLNNGNEVNIGNWRAIVLRVDLTNDTLSAIPVRTFNSFTNVVTDNAVIYVGDLVGASPTNIMEWWPSSNSLQFNVYSTKVFMDTYGVVMVNPILDITDYFTNLNDFYKLDLYNFSVYGSSITINGITGTITDNILTINNETVILKNVSIIYADGNAYIKDDYATIDLGPITDNDVSMVGAWYFQTQLYRGFTETKVIYTWDWSDFILNNTQFVVIYMGLALACLIVARKYCNLSIIDYCVLIASLIIALTVQVIA